MPLHTCPAGGPFDAIPIPPMRDLERTLRILRATPTVLRALLDGLGDELPFRDYGPGTFHPFDVLGHLILGERIDWLPRVRTILEHGTGRPFDPFPWDGKDHDTEELTVGERLDVFETLRADNLSALEELDLTADDLRKLGRHPLFGDVTLHQLLTTWGVHDLHHIAQVTKAASYQFRDEIGPWRPHINSIPN